MTGGELSTLLQAGDWAALAAAADGKRLRLSDGRLWFGLSRFVSVRGEDGRLYYGGDQNWDRRGLRGRYLGKTGCGVIALANLSFFFAGAEQVPMAEYRDRVGRVLGLVTPPVVTAGGFVRAVARLFPDRSASVLRSGRRGREEALRALAASLLEDRPVAMQIMGNIHGKAPGESRAVPWHWTVLTGLEVPLDHPERAVYTHSTWGEPRRGLFANAWDGGRGPLGWTSLVFFT